jgi:hypothetical protein
MDQVEKQALLEAVSVLITSPDAHQHFDALNSLYPLARAGHPVALAGDAAELNPMLRLRLRDPEGFDRVVDMIEAKRIGLGYDTLRKGTAADKGYDKVEYMRQFMDQKRERQRLAATIENLRRPEKDKLVGNARLEFMRRQSVRWKELRDQAMEAARIANGGIMTEGLRKTTLDKFWTAVDNDLASKHEEAKREALNPKRKVVADDMGDLLAALNLPAR